MDNRNSVRKKITITINIDIVINIQPDFEANFDSADCNIVEEFVE